MTTIKTVRPAPENVQNFIRTATPAQRMGFLCKGQPQCISLNTMNDGDFVTVFAPGLRGIIVGKEADTPEAAVEAAALRLNEFRAEDREDVDEASLGIDQPTFDLVTEFEEVGCRVEEIFHLGTMAAGDLSDALEEALDDLKHGSKRSALFEDLPLLKKVVRGSARRDEIAEALTLMVHDHGIFGFIVCISLPLHEPTGDGCARVHMGVRHQEYRYGHTFEIACQRALEWARGEYDRMMAEPVKKTA